MLCLDVASHMTIFNQSECLISPKCNYAMLNLVFDIKSLLFAFTTLKFWALKAIEGKRSKIGVKEVTD